MQQTVIIADDAQFMRLMLKDILEDMGLRVVAEATDGRQAGGDRADLLRFAAVE